MGFEFVLTFLVFSASLLIVASLKKEILNLPPIIHFTDVFNTQHSENEHDKTHSFSSSGSSYPQQINWPSGGYQQGSWHSGWPHTGQSGYPSQYHSGYNWQSGYPSYGYPQSGYHQHGYPPICHQYEGGRPHHRPRQEDVEVLERYFKFNEDGSKEYKLVLSNGLNIYQKMLKSNGDKQNIQMLEGYYSDKRDDGSFITTYFRADDTGYTASSEISDSPPSFPDVKMMVRFPDNSTDKKNKK